MYSIHNEELFLQPLTIVNHDIVLVQSDNAARFRDLRCRHVEAEIIHFVRHV